jgi:hypothetical protein
MVRLNPSAGNKGIRSSVKSIGEKEFQFSHFIPREEATGVVIPLDKDLRTVPSSGQSLEILDAAREIR